MKTTPTSTIHVPPTEPITTIYYLFVIVAQPPGIPEICKKSLTHCPVSGGMELFILGKNFLKDTKVIFQQHAVYDVPGERAEVIWEEVVTPDKEFLQQVKYICNNIHFLRKMYICYS